MTISTHVPRLKLRRATAFTAIIASAGLVIAFTQSAQAAAIPVDLGTAESFSVLAGAGITNTGETELGGDMGSFPNPAITGAPHTRGTDHGGDAVTQGAKDDLVTAYKAAAGQGPTNPITDDLTGKTLTRGVYNSASSVGLSGALTLDGEDDPDAVWVFQVGSKLTTAPESSVNLINGADPCNVYWQIGDSAALGTGSTFVGTLMALTSISLADGAEVEGRMLARNGAVTLENNTIESPSCDRSSGEETSDDTADQIADVPTGSVDTGSGEVVENERTGGLLGVVILGIGGTLAILSRRRRTS